MAHFARLDENNVVQEILVVNNEYLKDENGNEVESLGIAHMESVHGGRWIQTSYNSNIRYRFAGIGCIYDENLDAFLPPKPQQSWVLNQETYTWEPPIPMPSNTLPDGTIYFWNEETVNWIVIQVD